MWSRWGHLVGGTLRSTAVKHVVFFTLPQWIHLCSMILWHSHWTCELFWHSSILWSREVLSVGFVWSFTLFLLRSLSRNCTSQNSQRLSSLLFWAHRNFLILSFHIRIWKAKLRPFFAQLPLTNTCTLCDCPSSHPMQGVKAEKTVCKATSFRGLKGAKRQEHFLFPKYLPKNSTTQQVSFQGFGPWG